MTDPSEIQSNNLSELDEDGFQLVKQKRTKTEMVPRCIITQPSYQVRPSKGSKPPPHPKAPADKGLPSKRADDKLADLERRGLIGNKRS